MRNTFAFLFLILIILSCKEEKNKYQIQGSINQDSGKVYLWNFEESIIIDSARISNGEFRFKGSVDYPDYYYLMVKNSVVANGFMIENVNYNININENPKFYRFDINGGKLTDLYKNYLQIYDDKQNLIEQLTNNIDSDEDANKSKYLMKRDSVYNQIQIEIDSFINHNLTSMVSPYLVLFNETNLNKMENTYSKMNDVIKNSSGGMRLGKKIKKLQSEVKVGDNLPTMILPDLDGNKQNISSSIDKNQISLIDFWASWCKPCREQHPELKKIHKEYNQYGFDIMSISLDKNSTAWQKAIDKDGLNWIQLIDSIGLLQKKLGFNSIPTSYLVNRNKKIIAKNQNIEQLRAILDSIFLEK